MISEAKLKPRHLWALAAATLPFCASVSAGAEPLTCASFRERLEGALVQTALIDRNTEAPVFEPKRLMPDGASRFAWKTSDLSGTLSCDPADHFQEFYVDREVVPRDQLAQQVNHLVALDGAAICTLLAGPPSACSDAGKLLLQNAVQQMGAGLARRIKNPNGLSRAAFQGNVAAEMTAAPSLITFSLAPKDGGTVDAVRQPLGHLMPDQPTP